jgi:inorganic pyrophosphatase
MANLLKLPPFDRQGNVHVVVETPRGARAKLRYDPELRVFMLSKSLMAGLTYPYDWGFVPSTASEDGDPLDALVMHDAATSPGLVLKCKAIGVLEILEHRKKRTQRNDRVLAVPVNSHAEKDLDDVHQLSKQVRQELEKFFVATAELQSKTLECPGWRGPKHASQTIKSSARAFQDARGK